MPFCSPHLKKQIFDAKIFEQIGPFSEPAESPGVGIQPILDSAYAGCAGGLDGGGKTRSPGSKENNKTLSSGREVVILCDLCTRNSDCGRAGRRPISRAIGF